MELAREVRDYNNRLDWYISQKRLPLQWFGRVEYLTLGTADMTEFDDLVRRPKKERVIRVQEDDERFVVAAKLDGAFGLGKLGAVRWIRIEEIPEMEHAYNPVGLKDMDFYVQDFEQARYFLGARGIQHETIQGDEHNRINVRFDDEGTTFCLLDRPIEDVIGEMIIENRAQELSSLAA